MKHHSSSSCCAVQAHAHTQTITHEFLCHFPYALFAVALSLMVLSLLGYGSVKAYDATMMHGLFHTAHFLHILFAGTGTVIAFRKYGGGLFGSIIVGTLVPAFFCTLSDAIMPYFGGMIFGIPMHFHWCFYDHLATVIPFLGMGVMNGLLMSLHDESGRQRYVAISHFLHIFISAFASTIYMISHGFYAWQDSMAYVFMFLLIAVLIPCTLADVVVPSWFGLMSAARRVKKGGA